MAKYAKKAKGRKFKPRFKRSAKRSSWKKKSYRKSSGGALSAKVKRIVRSMEQTQMTLLNSTTTAVGTQFNAFSIWNVLGQGPPGPILAISGSTATTTSWGALLPPFAPTPGGAIIQPSVYGHRVEPKSLRVKLALDLNNVVAAKGQAVDITVDIYVLTSKQAKTVDLMANVNEDALLAPSSVDTIPYNGTIVNSQYPVNTRDFTVLKHHRIRMVKNYGDNPVTYPSTPVTPTAAYPTVQDHSAFRNVAFSIKCPAKLLFDPFVDGVTQVGLYPSNWNPMLAIGWFYNSSQAPLAVSPLTVTGSSYLSYKNLI